MRIKNYSHQYGCDYNPYLLIREEERKKKADQVASEDGDPGMIFKIYLLEKQMTHK